MNRQSMRLQNYDYAQAGGYFVTFCTENRECLFGEIENGEVRLNEMGRMVSEEWKRSEAIRKEVQLDEFVVMPNHIHGILFIAPGVGATGRSPSPDLRGPQSKSLGAFAAGFKSSVTKRINQWRQTPALPVWQRNYYERVIRNEQELYELRKYILENPLKWELDPENQRRVEGDRPVAPTPEVLNL